MSLEISFGKALVVNCEFTLRPERRRFLSESTPSVYPFAMDMGGSFCDTAILFLKKIAMVKFSNEPGSEPLLGWKGAIWVQETCLLIQAALLRQASRSFYRGANVSKRITGTYLILLSTLESIMMCRVFHLSTFRPPVDNAISCAHCRRRYLFIDSKKTCGVPSGSFVRSAVNLSNLKII